MPTRQQRCRRAAFGEGLHPRIQNGHESGLEEEQLDTFWSLESLEWQVRARERGTIDAGVDAPPRPEFGRQATIASVADYSMLYVVQAHLGPIHGAKFVHPNIIDLQHRADRIEMNDHRKHHGIVRVDHCRKSFSSRQARIKVAELGQVQLQIGRVTAQRLVVNQGTLDAVQFTFRHVLAQDPRQDLVVRLAVASNSNGALARIHPSCVRRVPRGGHQHTRCKSGTM
mmetsp:Transcript_58169/g.188262  ORF Transcript_58169/g.188262 Transcript_58169/m.188262 type:complete len:227 (+) Transcript_58169:157-837(+)